jgi:hypothetical protein
MTAMIEFVPDWHEDVGVIAGSSYAKLARTRS